jgi:hypothetical protein
MTLMILIPQRDGEGIVREVLHENHDCPLQARINLEHAKKNYGHAKLVTADGQLVEAL